MIDLADDVERIAGAGAEHRARHADERDQGRVRRLEVAVGRAAEDGGGLAAVHEALEDAVIDVDHAPGGGALVVVLVVAVAGQRRVGVGRHQRGGDLLAHLVVAQVTQQPGAPRIGGFHLERAVQLHRMTDDLVGDERVVVRIGHDGDFAVQGGQGRGVGQLHPVARQRQGERYERREQDGRLVHATGEDLPAPLVAQHVVQLLAGPIARHHDVAQALGEGEGLVDEGALGGREQLTIQLGHRRDVVVPDLPGGRRHLPRDVRREAHHLVEADLAGVDLEGRGDHLLAHRDRAEARVGEGLAEAPELALGVGLERRDGRRRASPHPGARPGGRDRRRRGHARNSPGRPSDRRRGPGCRTRRRSRRRRTWPPRSRLTQTCPRSRRRGRPRTRDAPGSAPGQSPAPARAA